MFSLDWDYSNPNEYERVVFTTQYLTLALGSIAPKFTKTSERQLWAKHCRSLISLYSTYVESIEKSTMSNYLWGKSFLNHIIHYMESTYAVHPEHQLFLNTLNILRITLM